MKTGDNISDKNPFRVPDGYFEEVNRKIISATSGERDAGINSPFHSRIRPYLLAAASVAGFIIMSYAAIKVIDSRREGSATAEVTTDGYNSPYFNDLDIYSIEETAASLSFSGHIPDVSNAEIIEYLVLDNIEINEIYEQL